MIHAIVTNPQKNQYSVRLPATIAPGLGKHLFLGVERKEEPSAVSFVSYPIDLRIFQTPLRTDNNPLLRNANMKTIRGSKTLNSSTGSALTAEVVSGQRIDVGAAYTAMTTAMDSSAFSPTVSEGVWHR